MQYYKNNQIQYGFFEKEFSLEYIATYFGTSLEKLITIKQVHSNKAVLINKNNCHNLEEGDAMVTGERNLALCIKTADCTPILMVESKNGIIAAIHAGWRGALAGITQNTLDLMENLGAKPENITAIIGPTICQKNYEVDSKFRDNFLRQDPQNVEFFAAIESKPHNFLFDLPGYNKSQLIRQNINVKDLKICTYKTSEHFFSHRRSTHNGETGCGRQFSAIILR